MQFKHTVTLDKHVNNLTGLYQTLPTKHSKILNTHIHTRVHTKNNTHLYKLESLDPEKCSHLHYLKIDRWGRQQTIIPRAQQGVKKIEDRENKYG